MSEQSATKVCGTCRVLVSVDGFYRQTASPDGLQRRCKKCNKVHAARPDVVAAHKAYRATPRAKALRDASAATPSRKATRAAYAATPSSKAARAAYAAFPHHKEVARVYQKAYGATERGRAAQRARAATYAATAHGKATESASTKKWHQDNPEKAAAHRSVSNAVRREKLVRPPSCSTCENTKHLRAHHDDYAKPLDVRWLCAPCHSAHHAAVRQVAHDVPALQQ